MCFTGASRKPPIIGAPCNEREYRQDQSQPLIWLALIHPDLPGSPVLLATWNQRIWCEVDTKGSAFQITTGWATSVPRRTAGLAFRRRDQGEAEKAVTLAGSLPIGIRITGTPIHPE